MLNATNLIEMKVKYSRSRHNAKQTSFTSPTGARRLQNGGKDNGDEAENGHAQTTQLKKQNKTKTEIRTRLSKELTAILPIIYR